MEKTLIVGSPNINGNIGSCEVKNVQVNKNFYTLQNIQTNSCTGEVISTNTYFDVYSLITVSMFLIIIWMFVRPAVNQVGRSLNLFK